MSELASKLNPLAVLAHPHDESLRFGGTPSRYAAEGVDVHLVTAAPGQRRRFFPRRERPSGDEVGRIRESELFAAASVLGIDGVEMLGYLDSQPDGVDAREAARRMSAVYRRIGLRWSSRSIHTAPTGNPTTS